MSTNPYESKRYLDEYLLFHYARTIARSIRAARMAALSDTDA